jgi:thiamine biosynthesis protein ThiS
MRVRVNGEDREVPTGISIAELLRRIGVDRRHLAVEHNREFLDEGRLEETILREGDRLEIVRFVGGG